MASFIAHRTASWRFIQLCAEKDGKIVDMLWTKHKNSEVDDAIGFTFQGAPASATQQYLESYQKERDNPKEGTKKKEKENVR